ncbi:unnamed protein product [Rhizophagus irregularis]|nr:unnamed protein product [Rhizophagus irregularis]
MFDVPSYQNDDISPTAPEMSIIKLFHNQSGADLIIISNIVDENVNNNRELNDVNPKQRFRILKRRSDRSKSNLSKKPKGASLTQLVVINASRRPRGSDGRFLKKDGVLIQLYHLAYLQLEINDSSKLTPDLCMKTEPSSYTSNASNMNENFLQSQSNAIELPQISNESNIIQLSIPVILYSHLLDAFIIIGYFIVIESFPNHK